MNDLDSTALAMLQDTHGILSSQGVQLCIAGAHQDVLTVLQTSGLWNAMGAEAFHLSPWRALVHALKTSGRDDELAQLSVE